MSNITPQSIANATGPNLDAIAVLIAAAYLLAVAWQGNLDTLIDKLKTQGDFLPWLASALALAMLQTIPALRPAITTIMVLLFLGALIQAGKTGDLQVFAGQLINIFGGKTHGTR